MYSSHHIYCMQYGLDREQSMATYFLITRVKFNLQLHASKNVLIISHEFKDSMAGQKNMFS